ncbi:MAG: TRAP transporter substrate-binding protein DctP [Synergistaceae bacterium]|nr:TRAP transporter substrate-binding protein DctP [Synergistaceae bacterium]MBP9958099.1 TRAP transporter substrate-binding protein DctP [Synergistaceae bacterium]
MRKGFCFLLLFMFSLLTVQPSYAEKFKPEYKMHVNVSENTAWGQAALMFANRVKELSGGKMNIKIYWSAQLIAGKQASESMFIRNGTIDFTLSGTSNYASVIPAMELTNLPFFISSHKDKFKAFDALIFGKTAKALEKQARDKAGVMILNWTENGFRELHYGAKRKPILTPADMKNIKIRYVSSLLYQDTFQALQANPMVINWNEAIQAYQQGLVDAGENAYSIIINYKVYEFHKQMTEWSYAVPAMFFATSVKMWDNFEPGTQKILKQASKEAGDWLRAVSRVGLDDGWGEKYLKSVKKFPPDPAIAPEDPIKFLKSKGVTIHRLTPEQIKPFRAVMKPVYDKWVPKIGKELVDQAEKEMAAADKK